MKRFLNKVESTIDEIYCDEKGLFCVFAIIGFSIILWLFIRITIGVFS